MSRSGETVRFVDAERLPEADFTAAERDALETVNQRIAAGDSLASIVEFLFTSTQAILPCDRVSVAFLADGEKRVVSHLTRALYEPVLLDTDYAEDLRGSSLAAVLKTGRLRIISDLEAYLARKPKSASSQLLVEEGVRSSLTCPIVVAGRRVGFLFRSARRTGAYGDREAALHLAVAERLSQAIEKAYRIEQLEAANRAYFEVLGFVSHELKSPLSSITMDARLLVQGYAGELNGKQQERIESIIRKAEHLLGMAGEYLDLARIESGKLNLSMTELDFRRDVADPSVDIVQPQIEEKGMRLEVEAPEGPIPITCDGRSMGIVMVNLLGNAVKYGEAQGLIRLALDPKNDELRVSVWNEGPGFPPDQRHRLFRKFSRIETPELLQRKGSGVGLYTSWRIVQAHGGGIDARSEPGRWAEFIVTLPRNSHEKGPA